MNAAARTDRAPLPRIVKFLGVDDCPESTCPHCGATGRYIVRFQVEDGRQLGAMRGCLKLFPVTELACEHEHLMAKKARYAKQRPPWRLSERDRDALQRIEEAIDGRGDAQQAIWNAQGVRAAAARRYRGRR